MKVILLQDVKALGKKGVVCVSGSDCPFSDKISAGYD